ncbi:large subunit terminase [Bdellovibrio phage phi1402]|uniref:large subunit terminase n=1 Tax=Bdellovibrio phage phi1402 TaxID=1035662 RepID=UPI000211A2C9|nr:large subunit terminase [Bdellovibrio phage phi1402]AEG42308.1 large subunit terminase [Bdellovibrio phage phi1402]
MGTRGPQPITINWDEFDKLVSYQCTQIEIAHFFGISVDWLDELCQRHRGEKLSDIWHKKKSLGRIRIRKAQFAIMEGMGPGAAAMAIYLDKKTMPEERFSDLPHEPTRDVTAIGAGLKTFAEFCASSGYFTPFPKQEEMRAFGMDRDQVRLLLGARGYGKTDFVTIMGVAYDLYCGYKSGNDLDLFTNLIITKSKSRNGAILNEIGEALKKNNVPLEVFNKSVIRIQGLIGQDHSVEAITIKSSMRGRHPKRIIMDDPVTDEDVSEAMRTVVKRRYDEAYKLCKNILIIGQPAHAFDLYSELRDVIDTMEVPHGSIPELDADLAAMTLAGVDKTSIEMSYHLRIPKDGASVFSALRFIEKFHPGDSVAFIDPSDGGDYTAMSIIKGYMEGVAVKGRAWQKAWYHCVDDIVAELRSCGVRRVAFETNKFGREPVERLQALLSPYGIGVVGIHSESNKEAMILSAGSYAHMIHLSRCSDKIYTDQVVKYEKRSKYDDCPDSLARGLEWLGLLRHKK